ncbi:hypothetical protein HX109_04955 [Galbibacter sp. BG1]|uniref:hypothetical protein n=1 Tax=Galbibacter sp. BG1 TaxID=1170699 RepID=UPI0015BE8ABE|nr:hypothetical protein [Galbibacter sp. BG1]QLE00944.1 hypothetical protein HX109_04955 [Galbibacter sp. BG1]
MKNLESFGIQELDAKETIQVDGGLQASPYGLYAESLHSAADFVKGFWDRFTLNMS